MSLDGTRYVARDGARRRRHLGQAVVELALILPVFLFLTIGVVDLARVFAAYIALNDGVREAALFAADGDGYDRWCAIPPDDTIACPPGSATHQFPNPDNIAYQVQFDALGLDPAQITLQAPACTPSPCGPTSAVTVAVSYRVALLTPVLNGVFGGGINLSTSTTAKVLP